MPAPVKNETICARTPMAFLACLPAPVNCETFGARASRHACPHLRIAAHPVLAPPSLLARICELPDIRCLRLQARLLAFANCHTLVACASKHASLHLRIAAHWVPAPPGMVACINELPHIPCLRCSRNQCKHIFHMRLRLCASNIKQRGLYL